MLYYRVFPNIRQCLTSFLVRNMRQGLFSGEDKNIKQAKQSRHKGLVRGYDLASFNACVPRSDLKQTAEVQIFLFQTFF